MKRLIIVLSLVIFLGCASKQKTEIVQVGEHEFRAIIVNPEKEKDYSETNEKIDKIFNTFGWIWILGPWP